MKQSLKATSRKVQESINMLDKREQEITSAIKRQQSDLDFVLKEKASLISQRDTLEKLVK